jgi:hypothetical protein
MTSGETLFARYAYPPNALGYCGPAEANDLFVRALAACADLRAIVGRFDNGPYLGLIADAAGIDDPFDARVVEAYWLGNDLLERVPAAALRSTLERWPQGWSGARWDDVARFVEAGAVPHHSFHVFGAYPWLRLLKAGVPGRPLEVLDRCRVRWGTIESVDGDTASVRGRRLTWNGVAVGLGPLAVERATLAIDGQGFVPDVRPGETVALHWDWVCDRLTPDQLSALCHYTERHLALAAA